MSAARRRDCRTFGSGRGTLTRGLLGGLGEQSGTSLSPLAQLLAGGAALPVVDGTIGSIVVRLAHDEDLARQAEVNNEQQFGESPALPKAFADAVIGVRDDTPQFVGDILGDTGLFNELAKALPAMLYEYFRASTKRD